MDDEFALDEELDLDAEPEVEPAYESVEDWVQHYLARVIQRRISDRPGHGLTWDARWWRHGEAVARLTALWWAWESARRSVEDRSAMSGWWVDHCEPHLRMLLDGVTGPMSGADDTGTWGGYGPLTCEPVPAGWVADDLADLPHEHPVPIGEDADELPAPAFLRLEDFVEKYLSHVINRKIDDKPGRGLSWDRRWWQHQEVVSRLRALWWAFEEARSSPDDPAAMSSWWLRHCDPQMRVLLDGESGPMSNADVDGSWPGHGTLLIAYPPEGWQAPKHLTP
ncbi:DUF4913 domain-containing protein [Rhodococcus sp. KRD175]|uniref:DUF4913 domain-containing protein n=1 Tax=Rhodococcus sp. KRD175 TaxID=2729729 RepID=UPI0019D05E32|nr:DUF4913 domain-containing protein [Rhodococcus sp. KRD175]